MSHDEKIAKLSADGKEMRRCIVTGNMLSKSMLLRFVVAPGKKIVPDIACKLQGKGLWVSADKKNVALALQKKLFSKAAKMAVITDSALPEQLELLLKAACLNMLAMAKKSGVLITGHAKVCALQDEEKAVLILRACDSAFAAQEKQTTTGRAPVVILFSNDELSSALGCENVVHVALRQSAVTDKCKMLIKRYTHYIR